MQAEKFSLGSCPLSLLHGRPRSEASTQTGSSSSEALGGPFQPYMEIHGTFGMPHWDLSLTCDPTGGVARGGLEQSVLTSLKPYQAGEKNRAVQ